MLINGRMEYRRLNSFTDDSAVLSWTKEMSLVDTPRAHSLALKVSREGVSTSDSSFVFHDKTGRSHLERYGILGAIWQWRI